MANLSDQTIGNIIEEILESSEVTRRALAKRRLDIYRDGGKEFLLEQITREFGSEAIKEMRIAPINLLKKIINKRSSIYSKAPTRTPTTGLPSDQELIDFYVEDLSFNEVMLKANRYFNLFSNTVLYTFPKGGRVDTRVVPPFLYSVVPAPIDKTQGLVYVFNAFDEEGLVKPLGDVPSATGSGFTRQRSFKTAQDKVDSREFESDLNRRYIFWTPTEHFTTDQTGARIVLNPDKGPEQFVNPIGINPVTNIAKDRDNEFWATQGADMTDLTIAIQLGWTDLLTIAKHQGFSILTVISPEEPTQLNIGINRAVWLKSVEGSEPPRIDYVQGNSPLAQYKDLLMDLLGLLLTTNDMNPGTITGSMNTQNVMSGFSRLVQMADTLEAREQDKPVMMNAEREDWEVRKRWHNWMFDQGLLDQDVAALGKFSEDFGINIDYADMKPIESDDDRIRAVRELRAEGLLTREDALRRLNPDIKAEEIEAKIKAIDEEMEKRRNQMIGTLEPNGQQEDQV